MRHRHGLYVLVALAIGLRVVTSLAAEPKGQAGAEGWRTVGPSQVEVAKYEWTDEARHREVPVNIYYPASGGRHPIIIMSHGLGGSRDGYEYLGRHWASHGYVSVHVQHKGSDDAVWKEVPIATAESMQKSAAQLVNALNRPKDVSFVIDRLEQLDRDDGPLHGRLDMTRIGMAGHSFGGYTTMAIAGQTAPGLLGKTFTLADRRVRAAVPMSAPCPNNATSWIKSSSRSKSPACT